MGMGVVFQCILFLLMVYIMFPCRHPRLSYNHSHRDVSGVSLRWVWRVYFHHSQWLQRRSQPLSWSLTVHSGDGVKRISNTILRRTNRIASWQFVDSMFSYMVLHFLTFRRDQSSRWSGKLFVAESPILLRKLTSEQMIFIYMYIRTFYKGNVFNRSKALTLCSLENTTGEEFQMNN